MSIRALHTTTTTQSLTASVSDTAPTATASMQLATQLNNLAACLYEGNRLDDAEDLYRSALEVMKAVLDNKHITDDAPENYGGWEKKLDEFSGDQFVNASEIDVPSFCQALLIPGEHANDEKVVPAFVLHNMALLQVQKGVQEKATPLLEMSLSMLHPSASAFSSDDSNGQRLRMSIKYNLGAAYQEQGREDEAMRMFTHALQIGKATLSTNHLLIACILNKIGNILLAHGYMSEALAAFDEASCKLDQYSTQVVKDSRQMKVEENPAAPAA